MITGFNTDIEHEGTIYHVQTEDKGLETPLILSLVYVGGAILASKRAPYDDLIEKGFDEKELAERLNRQHKLICAAIRAGRIDDLKRMSQRDGQSKKAQGPSESARVDEAEPLEIPPPPPVQKTSQPAPKVAARAKENAPSSLKPKENAASVLKPESAPSKNVKEAAAHAEAKVKRAAPVQKGGRQSVRAILQDVVADFARAEAASDAGIHLSLIDEEEFKGGANVMLKIRVGRGAGGREGVGDAEITVKVLGSTFRPLIFPTRTGTDGVATVRAVLPHFKTGRAAILVRAIADGYEAELRRIIHQG
jgi:hypothetical protein